MQQSTAAAIQLIQRGLFCLIGLLLQLCCIAKTNRNGHCEARRAAAIQSSKTKAHVYMGFFTNIPFFAKGENKTGETEVSPVFIMLTIC
jgi:hypothetical protein